MLGRRDSLSYENGGPDSESHRQSTDPPHAGPSTHPYVLTVDACARPRLRRIGCHCVAWVSSDGDQSRQRHTTPIGAVGAPPRRGTDPGVRLDGVAGADVRRNACRPEDHRLPTRSPNTNTSRCGGGAATERSGCSAQTRRAAPSFWSGCVRRISPRCRTSTPARWSPGSTGASTSLRCPNCTRSLRISSSGRASSRRYRAAPRSRTDSSSRRSCWAAS